MLPTKVRNLKVSGTDETSRRKGAAFAWGLSPDSWDFTLLMPIPVDYFLLGLTQFETSPSLVLAPESALRLPPGRPLSQRFQTCAISGGSLAPG